MSAEAAADRVVARERVQEARDELVETLAVSLVFDNAKVLTLARDYWRAERALDRAIAECVARGDLAGAKRLAGRA